MTFDQDPRPAPRFKREPRDKPVTYTLGDPYVLPPDPKTPRRPKRPKQQVVAATIGRFQAGGIYALVYREEGMTPARYRRLVTILRGFALAFRPRLTFLLFPEGHKLIDMTPAAVPPVIELPDAPKMGQVTPAQVVTDAYHG